MFDNYQICPYTGLRSFSEDESLYFKGREEDIDQATSQLQKNKFLMLTGASGDGKSSLVYAGIIPNARAGFLKSKYTNWAVASFRPERTPFQNLSNALAKQLDISNSFTVQGELNHGFSALVDLYKNSKRFADANSSAWLAADDKGRAAIKREAANLIILVDQFEEFFTNPENYQHGAPSRDANLVLNLLLETARIALDEDIPIYVIFTMRSDYIGQCAAFRGLPEYIGFSQFFVPRLNRSQLQQVVEEPATLSGNRIARRLTERLIHDLTEGVDQLPTLQHALKQIWIAADSGKEEMDLVHYAMAGGMPLSELPEEQTERFTKWFSSLPDKIKACYHAPSLQNVLDTHTNKLYEQAAGYYKAKTGYSISDADAKIIVRTAFTCLTKIDQSRAVRNRMTLQEITNILGNPAFDYVQVGALLNIFREPDNTFINPFISEDDPESTQLNKDTVLDITHESLIRNWQYLGQWAKEEFDSHAVSLDFEKQLDRWVHSGKSNNFLLSIGPLTYFENWYNKANPNAWWIARYLPEDINNETRLNNANKILDNSREFIKKSSDRHLITRTIMRYGPRRIALLLGLLALIVLSSFTIRDYFRKQNSYVLDSIHQQAMRMAANPKVNPLSKSLLITEELRRGSMTLDNLLKSIPDSLQQIDVLNGLAALMIYQGKDEPKDPIERSLSMIDSLLSSYPVYARDPQSLSSILKEINMYGLALQLADFYAPNPKFVDWLNRNGQRSARWVKQVLTAQPAGFQDMLNFNMALESAINYSGFTKEELNQITNILSPFEKGSQSDWLKSNFQADKLSLRGSIAQNYGFKHNGLYQELAYLYAAEGNSEKAIQCIDTLLANSQNNFQQDYASGGDNAANIAAVYFRYGNMDALNRFADGYCARKKITAVEFYERMIGRVLHGLETSNTLRLYSFMDENLDLNIKFPGRIQLGLYFKKYREVLETTVPAGDQKNFLLALSYKNEGILKSLIKEPAEAGDLDTKGYFDKAVSIYRMVSEKYLNASISVVRNAIDENLVPRKSLFIYPDMMLAFHPSEPRAYFFYFFSDVYLDYILQNNLFGSFYPGSDELNYLSEWISDYNTVMINLGAFMVEKPRYSVLKNLEQLIAKTHQANKMDINWLYFYLGKEAQDSGRLDEMTGYYDKIDKANIYNLFLHKDFFGFVRDQSLRLVAMAVEGYVKAEQFEKAHQLIVLFKNPVNRSTIYSFAATQLLKERKDLNNVQQLIDSAFVEMDRKENRSNYQPNRGFLAYAITMENPNENLQRAYTLIRNLPSKIDANQEICRALAFHGQLYEAQKNIPDFNSASDQASFLWYILRGYQQGQPADSQKGWDKFINISPPRYNLNITYVEEHN
jgi:energy-coupling factor transporter ATP-binding protein EcfA2